MAIATITSVNLPTHQYPHVEVNINDNTLRRYTTNAVEYGRTLCVFRSPKGPDGLRKITGYDQFVDTYGEGSVADYGQPLLNARTLAATNAVTQYCLRVSAHDAIVANLHIFARYRVKNYYIDQTTGIPHPGKISVYFVAKTDKELHEASELVTKDAYANDAINTIGTDGDGNWQYTPATLTIEGETVPYYVIPADGTGTADNAFDDWKEVRLMSVVALGKGVSGNNISFTISPDVNRDKSNNFKNYIFQVYEGSSLIEKFAVTVTSNGIVRGESKYISNVVNDDDYTGTASSVLRVDFNEDAVKLIYNEYNKRVNPGYVSYDEFDALFGQDKKKLMSRISGTNKNLPGYIICADGLGDNDDPSGASYSSRITAVATLPTTGTIAIGSLFEFTGDTAGSYTKNHVYELTSITPGQTQEDPDTYVYTEFAESREAAIAALKAADMASGEYFPDEAIGTDTAGTTVDYYNFIAVTGTPLASGNDGKFRLASDGGTAKSVSEIEQEADAQYKAVFAGTLEARSAQYKIINTIKVFVSATDTTGTVYTLAAADNPSAHEIKRPDGGLTLYFDEDNNYLLDYKIIDPTIPDDSTIRYRLAYKQGTEVIVPFDDSSEVRTPDMATGEFPYPEILTKNKTSIDFFLDANYSYQTKLAICNWVNKYRSEDFVVYLDAGVSDTLVSKVDGYTWVQAFDNATNGDDYKRYWYFSIDAYYGKIKDPYNYKIVEVTSTYNLARHLVPHWAVNGGKHIPYAGSLYAVIDSYLPGSVFPLMDEGLDSAHMDRFIEEHVNYAQVNSRGDVIRATQSTRYPILGDAFTLSNLTELNNVHIVLDIKKDVENILELFTYQFNEPSDIKRFNTVVSSSILPKYSDAQVKSISATFNRTSEEAEYGILHLYIEVVHKNLVKIIMVDIDVNRNTD